MSLHFSVGGNYIVIVIFTKRNNVKFICQCHSNNLRHKITIKLSMSGAKPFASFVRIIHRRFHFVHDGSIDYGAAWREEWNVFLGGLLVLGNTAVLPRHRGTGFDDTEKNCVVHSSFYRATLCVSAVFAVGRCPSVCLAELPSFGVKSKRYKDSSLDNSATYNPGQRRFTTSAVAADWHWL